MKKLIVLFILLLAVPCFADDMQLSWDAVSNATGYKIYWSSDLGVTWEERGDIATNVADISNIPSTGLQIFRVSAYNDNGESIRTWSGAWYNGDWKPIEDPSGAGIK